MLKGSRLAEKSTIESLRLSPFVEHALLGPQSLKEAKDMQFVKLSELAVKQHQQSQSGSTSASSADKPQKTGQSGRGGVRVRPYAKKKSFGNRGSGRKSNLQ